MQLFYLIEEGMMTTVQAPDMFSALRHYAEVHGWRFTDENMVVSKGSHFELYGGEIQIHLVNPLAPVAG